MKPFGKPKRPSRASTRSSGVQREASLKAKSVQSATSAVAKRSGSKPPPKVKKSISRPRSKPKSSPPRTEAQYIAKPERFKNTWDRVVAVVSKMRRERVSLAKASREVGVSPRAVTRWGKQALRKGSDGRYHAAKQDSLYRALRIPTLNGTQGIAVRGSKQAALLAEYWNALHLYLQTGDAARLKKFAGKHIKDANGTDVPLLTDLPKLNRLGSAGVLSFESLYARST